MPGTKSQAPFHLQASCRQSQHRSQLLKQVLNSSGRVSLRLPSGFCWMCAILLYRLTPYALILLYVQDWHRKARTLLHWIMRSRQPKQCAVHCQQRFRRSKKASTGTRVISGGEKQVHASECQVITGVTPPISTEGVAVQTAQLQNDCMSLNVVCPMQLWEIRSPYKTPNCEP